MRLCMGCMTDKGDNVICPICGLNENDLAAASPAFIRPGHELKQGRYTVGIALGQGGFGITYIGYDNVLGTKVAIKEYYPSDIAQRVPGDRTVMPFTNSDGNFEHGKQKFLEEARILAKFSDYPGIVSVRDCFDENGTAYMVMQYLDGTDLKTYLGQHGGRLGTDESIKILMPVLAALKEVHRAGVIHRDISPDNIFMTADGQVKLIDFGAARQGMDGQKSLSVTLKPGYAPEEQYRTRGNQGPWTDVYALTATLYRMITGNTPPDSLERLMNDEMVIPNYLPENIRLAIQKGMAVKAADRFATIDELQAALTGEYKPDTQASMTNKAVAVQNSGGGGALNTNNVKAAQSGTASGFNKKLIILAASLAAVLVCAVTALIIVAVSGGGNDFGGSSQPAATTVTPKKTKKIVEHTYEVVVKMCTWETARQEAVSAGGHLVTINDSDEFTKIKNMLDAYSNVRNVWVGACAPEGYYTHSEALSYWNSSSAKWITGEPFTFARWREGEPSGSDKNTGVAERYIQIFKPKADGVWSFNDAGDDMRFYKPGSLAYIIEYEKERIVEE